MVFGENPGDMDAATALQAFLATFRIEDKKLKTELIELFILGFRHSFNEVRKKILEIMPLLIKDALATARNLYGNTYHAETSKEYIFNQVCLDQVFKIMYEGRIPFKKFSAEGLGGKDKARKLGEILGAFLAYIEYFVSSTDPNIQRYVRWSTYIADGLTKVIESMHELGITIKPKFIANRIRQIARRKAGELTQEQQYLLSYIASRFV